MFKRTPYTVQHPSLSAGNISGSEAHEETMAYTICVSYHLSDRGRREALKAGLEPTGSQTFYLNPESEGYGAFADLVDLEKAHEDYIEGLLLKIIPHTVGEPFGYKVTEVWEDVPWEPIDWKIEESPVPETTMVFDAPMTVLELADAESKHLLKKRLTLQRVERELANKQTELKASQNAAIEKRLVDAASWLKANKKWSEVTQVSTLEHIVSRGGNPDQGDRDESPFTRAIEAVALQEAMIEAKKWIAHKGSRRLNLIVEENLLHTSMNAYREERISKDFPKWSFVKKAIPRWRQTAPLNPTEEALDKLLTARKDFAEATLVWDRENKEAVILAEFLGKQVTYNLSSYADDIPF